MPEQLSWTIEKLNARHNRQEFCCGVDDLDQYLSRFARQNEKAGISQHFVATTATDHHKILGYYCLSAASVSFKLVPDKLKKRLPRYPIPVAHLGRLAVDQSAQNCGLGEDLLLDALARSARAGGEIGIHAIEVTAINDTAKRFYLKYGFTQLSDNKYHLYLPLSVVQKLGLVT